MLITGHSLSFSVMVYIFLDSDIKLIEKYIIHIQIYYDYEYADFKIFEFAMFIL